MKLPPIDPAAAARRLLKWYDGHARDLPWRHSHDPYAIWLSEVLLQQTRVETALPYYRRFLAEYPNLRALARAPLRQVLRSWEGLGYYARARNFHRAARLLADRPDRGWPRTAASWLRLPGVGNYTAGAIASIAYGECVPALDANARRVLARLWNYRASIRSASGERALIRIAQTLIPCPRAGDFNQALMDLGAIVCSPGAPDCPHCPLRVHCRAFAAGAPQDLPRRSPRRALPHQRTCAAILQRRGRYLLRRRTGQGLLGELWEFPGGRPGRSETLAASLERSLWRDLGIRARAGRRVLRLDQAYSHVRVTRHVFPCESLAPASGVRKPRLRWVKPAVFRDYPMGKSDRLIANWILAQRNRAGHKPARL